MPWYVYGITTVEALDDVGPGIDDTEVVLLGDGPLRGVAGEVTRTVRDLEQADPADTVEAVRRHDEVLTVLADSGSVLPVRFGTLLADRAAVDDLLADPDGRLARSLDRIAGAQEWVVRVDVDPTDEPPEAAAEATQDLTPGHAYFARRRAEARARGDRRRHAVDRAGQVQARFDEHARASRSMPAREPDTLGRVAYLVDRDRLDDFVAVASDADGVEVLLQGPLPPYRFVDEDTP